MRDGKMRAKLEDFLQEVCEKTITNNQYPVLTSSKSGLFLQSDYFNKQVASKDNTGYKIIRRGQFTYRAMSDTGKFFPNMLECADVGIVSPAYPVFEIIKQDQIVPEYLNYYFKSNRFQNSISTFAQGSTRTSVKFGKLKKVSIELPEIKKQYQIIRTLDLLRTIINNRKKEVLELDELIRARFVEMFGDPVSNPYKLPTVLLGELSELITKGASPSWQGFNYTDDPSQTLFLTSENVKNGYIDLSSPKYIEDKFNTKQKRSIVHKGDFLINIVGASIGRAAQFNLNCKANMNQAAALVRINDNRIRDKYLLTYLNSDKAQLMYDSMKSDTGRANLSLKDISELSILLPSIEEQLIFEKVVAQIDKSKLLSGCRLFHSWAPENRDKPKHVGVPRRRTKVLRGCRRQQ